MDTVLNHDETIKGMVRGNLIISAGAEVIVRGMVAGNIIVKEGGKLKLYGMCTGNINAENAEVRVFGTLIGSIFSKDSKVFIDPKAAIKNEKVN
ncbi:hypothetical protein [Listeria booriae]|uniref:hypothetical protein n=1 Tax=Listeria booriae TaxID=1552123 RepID=UPI001628A269|nr:hypothetical protein [Listeria booriae]MBC1231505.1 hypothetical protein [Listeria booriae]MBC1801108.1 hypothetical protein [Listeria booriae]